MLYYRFILSQLSDRIRKKISSGSNDIFSRFFSWVSSKLTGKSSSTNVAKDTLNDVYEVIFNASLHKTESLYEDIATQNNLIFSQKRLGDQLQARAVKDYFNGGTKSGVKFITKKDLFDDKEFQPFEVKHAVLVTHGRMLFCLALIPIYLLFLIMELQY